MSLGNRELTYGLAINEALKQMLRLDQSLLVIGQGVKSPWYVGSTCADLISEFGEERVIDTPVSENAMTGAAVGAAISGSPAIVVHPRVDFMMYAIDPIVNEAANWHYMSGGQSNVPVVFWGIVNRGGEQAAQHSQALQAMFAHIPGLKLIMPSCAKDAKGLMISALKDPNPVVFIDDRWLYGEKSLVPEEMYEIPIGKAEVKREGKDLTIVSSSYLAAQSLSAANELSSEGFDVEVVDLRTIKPIDEDTILESVKKTGRLLVVDGGWQSFGVSAEISAIVSEKAFSLLKGPISRLALKDIPAPAADTLESAFYINKLDIKERARKILR